MTSHAQAAFTTLPQDWLLRAALLREEEAIDAWERWKTHVDIDTDLDHGSFRLLPLVYKNLDRHGVTDPLMGRLKGVYRLAWVENQRKFLEAEKILTALQDARIPTLLLKGAALSLLHYRDSGVRPMADIDLLVPPDHAKATIALLTDIGWTALASDLDAHLMYRHALSFNDAAGRELDLHWRVFFDCQSATVDADFWRDAVPVKLRQVPTLALNPTDTLLHVIVHGVKWNPEPPIRWISDAMAILYASGNEIDWQRLIAQARLRRISYQLKVGLDYLHDSFEAPIPEAGLRALSRMPVSRLERFEFRYYRAPEEQRSGSLLGDLPVQILEYLRFAAGMPLYRKISELPRYFRYRVDARDLRSLVRILLSKSVRRAKIALSPGPSH